MAPPPPIREEDEDDDKIIAHPWRVLSVLKALHFRDAGDFLWKSWQGPFTNLFLTRFGQRPAVYSSDLWVRYLGIRENEGGDFLF